MRQRAFYNRLVSIMRDYCGGHLSCSVKIINAAGIGQYKSKVLRIFEKQIKRDHPKGEFYIALCYDQDVFEINQNPPVQWIDVKKAFLSSGAKNVCLIKAVKSIEDCFFYDTAGILTYLRLAANTKLPSGNGYERLTDLFQKSNKVYLKGRSSGQFVEKLNMKQILSNICPSISPLCKLLGVNCE